MIYDKWLRINLRAGTSTVTSVPSLLLRLQRGHAEPAASSRGAKGGWGGGRCRRRRRGLSFCRCCCGRESRLLRRPPPADAAAHGRPRFARRDDNVRVVFGRGVRVPVAAVADAAGTEAAAAVAVDDQNPIAMRHAASITTKAVTVGVTSAIVAAVSSVVHTPASPSSPPLSQPRAGSCCGGGSAA